MADVKLTIKPSTNRAVPAMPRRIVDVTYSRKIGDPPREDPDAPRAIRDVAQVPLGDDATAVLTLVDVDPDSQAVVRFLSGTGASRLERTIESVGRGGGARNRVERSGYQGPRPT